MSIQIEYRVRKNGSWRASCPSVPEFRARIEKRLFLAKGAALSELEIAGVDEDAVVTHVLVDSEGDHGDGERFELKWPVATTTIQCQHCDRSREIYKTCTLCERPVCLSCVGTCDGVPS